MGLLPTPTYTTSHRRQNILLGQLNSNGDCLYATTIARQIKTDNPECHLTWAVGSMCKATIEGNPYVDEIWEIPLKNMNELSTVWNNFMQKALERMRLGAFDRIYFTQIAPGNLYKYDGSIRSTIYRGYPYKISVPVAPVVKLSPVEVENVRRFAEKNHLHARKHVILVESSPNSGQSFMTHDFACELARKVVSNIDNSCVILSSNISFNSLDERIIDGSTLSFKENAELSKYCTLLVGCSSGISWLCTSDWAKRLPMVQLLKQDVVWSNSLICDHEQWGLPTENIIEMLKCSVEQVYCCIETISTEGFLKAKYKYHNVLKDSLYYFKPIFKQLLYSGQFIKCIKFLLLNLKKHGIAIFTSCC